MYKISYVLFANIFCWLLSCHVHMMAQLQYGRLCGKSVQFFSYHTTLKADMRI